jgi:2,3-dihydroxyphenylpropionate 1,2-dioxygenase
VLGTGGLSHALPIPHPDAPPFAGDAELRAQMLDGRADPQRLTRLLVERIKRVGDSGAKRFNEDFDREVIDALRRGAAGELAERSSEWIAEQGGNGGQEVRNWLAVAAATRDRPAELLAYEAVQPWLTGMAFMKWQLG